MQGPLPAIDERPQRVHDQGNPAGRRQGHHQRGAQHPAGNTHRKAVGDINQPEAEQQLAEGPPCRAYEQAEVEQREPGREYQPSSAHPQRVTLRFVHDGDTTDQPTNAHHGGAEENQVCQGGEHAPTPPGDWGC
ncbi:MAG: hypothetical protein QOJ19_737 [Acidimicrobiia bacterium]|nr:hypothetical protein [Acidimicrobiia bacterium]